MEQAVEEQNICASHLVQFYRKKEYLAESVTEFIQLGLAKGDGVFVLATREHWQSFRKTLLLKEPRMESYLAEQRLVYYDAQPVMERILRQGQLDQAAFLEFIQNILERMQTYANVRAYGELVNLLCSFGKIQEALALEKVWNDILEANPRLVLMCGYDISHVEERIQPISAAHSHTILVENIQKLEDEEALYRRIAVLEQRYAALQHNYQDRHQIENELAAIKKQLTQSGKLSILGELCAGIAHELNNPLAIIHGSIQNSRAMVARSSEPMSSTLQEIIKRLDYIDAASSRITKIVHNVLMFAKQQDHCPVAFDVKQALYRAIDFMQCSMRLEHIQLQILLPDDEIYTLGDQEAIMQTFVNIMGNARDALASNDSDRRRILTVAAQKIHDHRIEITFQDSGIGMDEQTLGKVFYPFFTTKDVGKGMGLGLAISHGIISKHNGQISCESKPGQGTLVRVILPELLVPSKARRA